MKNFLSRLITGIIYVGLICLCISWGSLSFLALFSLVTFLCLWEYYGIINTKRNAGISRWFNSAGGVLLFVSTYLACSGVAEVYIFFPYLLYLIYTYVYEVFAKSEAPFLRLSRTILGQVYIAVPLSLLNAIAFRGGDYLYVFVLSLFIFIWVNDTGAYIVGVTLGKHRLCERISPKKSWEGFWGGLVFTFASSFVFSYLYPEISWLWWASIALAIVVFGTFGDLVESLFKRNMDIKDSGHSLPGHGGFLDRFDSLLLAVYAMYFLEYFYYYLK